MSTGRNSVALGTAADAADALIGHLHPRSIFDIACENGFLVEAFQDRCVDARGFGEWDSRLMRPDLRERYLEGRAPDQIPGGPYDLVLCLGALDELSDAQAREAVRDMARAAPAVFFSAAYGGAGAGSAPKPPLVEWLRMFAEFGFRPDLCFDPTPFAPEAILLRRSGGSPEETESLVCDLLRFRMESARLRTALQSLETATDRLTRERDRLQVQVREVTSGPAWQLTSRYRGWLRASRARARWVERAWRLASWPLLKSGVLAREGPAAVDARRAREIRDYHSWCAAVEPSASELAAQREASAAFSYRPKISVLVPVYRVPVPVLREMIDSVASQTYGNWELCISFPREVPGEIHECLAGYARQDSRIRLKELDSNLGISGNSNQALALASGDYAALLDHDDSIAPHAFFEAVQLLNQDPLIDLIYSDRDELLEDGNRARPFFKPDWSPDTLLNTNFVTHLCLVRTELVRQAGGWRSETDGAQDWDLYARVLREARNVRHIPKILYHWRWIESSVAMRGLDAKPWAAAGMVKAAQDHLDSVAAGPSVAIADHSGVRIQWPVPDASRAVSVILISSAPGDETSEWAQAVMDRTSFPNCEFLMSAAPGAAACGKLRLIPVSPAATLAEKIEASVAGASGAALVFLDQSLMPGDPGWLTEMTSPLDLAGVGLTGGRIVDAATGRLRHCGLVITSDGRVEYIHAGQFDGEEERTGSTMWYRNWSAVSGACFAIRRETWDSVNGLGGARIHGRLDVNLCLRLRIEKDLRILYNPFARFTQTGAAAIETWHANSFTRVRPAFRERFVAGDPYLNANLDCRDGKVDYAQGTTMGAVRP